jgi:hypothetical protein
MPLRERLREAIAAASTRSARDEIRRRLIGAGAETYAAHAARRCMEQARQALASLAPGSHEPLAEEVR